MIPRSCLLIIFCIALSFIPPVPAGARTALVPQGEERETSNRPAMISGAGTWLPVGNGLPGQPFCATEMNGGLYVVHYRGNGSGSFDYSLSVWDGASWKVLDSFVANALPAVLGVYEGSLYMGGTFTSINDQAGTAGLVRWDGSAWKPVTGGVVGDGRKSVQTMQVYQGELYCGGLFVRTDEKTSPILRWNGTAWGLVGDDITEPGASGFRVLDLVVDQGSLYAAGQFEKLGSKNVARWDGTSWYPLGTGIGGHVRQMEALGDDLYIYGSSITRAGDPEIRQSARWNGHEWLTGIDADISLVSADAMLALNGRLYLGARVMAGLYTWDGANWGVVSTAIGPYVLVVFQGELYAGGPFERAGGITYNYFARLDESGGASAVPAPVANDATMLFPNPVHDAITITGDLKTGEAVTMRDAGGRIVLDRFCDGGDMILDIRGMPSGTYFVEIPLRDGIIVRQVKVVK